MIPKSITTSALSLLTLYFRAAARISMPKPILSDNLFEYNHSVDATIGLRAELASSFG